MSLPEPERTLADISAAIQHPQPHDFMPLLERAGNLNLPNKKGYPLLHLAAMNGHTELAEALIAHGADVRQLDTTHFQAARWATSTTLLNEEAPPADVDLYRRMSTIHTLLLQAGASDRHIINAGYNREHILRRDQWFDEALTAIKEWHRIPRHDITAITPKLVCQFASFHREAKLMTPELWRSHEVALQSLLGRLPPYLMSDILGQQPGLIEILHPAPPYTLIDTATTTHRSALSDTPHQPGR